MSWFEKAIAGIVMIAGFLLCLFLTYVRRTEREWAKEQYDIYRLHSKIAWINYEACNPKKDNEYLRNMFFLPSNQKEYTLEYGKKEAKYLTCISSAFREKINQLYFGNDSKATLLDRQEVYLNMDKELYFLVYLFFFLDSCTEDILGRVSEYRLFEFDHEKDKFTSLYKLTDFGLFYYKLFYYVRRHCEEHPYIRSNHSYERDEPYYGIKFAPTLAGISSDDIKKAIDSGMVENIRYH